MLMVLASPLSGRAMPIGQAEPLEVRSEVTYTFGNQVDFWAVIPPDVAAQSPQVIIFWQPQGEMTLWQAPMAREEAQYHAALGLAQTHLRPFAEVRYWFRATFADGHIAESAPQAFRYEDNRFAWQTLASEPFEVHWYAGDISFGQSLLNEAQTALQRSAGWMSLPPTITIHIYAYADPADVQSALQLSGYGWVAGHADPDLNTILVSLPPGLDQQYEIGRQVPHELMHILLYHKVGAQTAPLPAWLEEGLASNAERIPNPDYAYLLRESYQGGQMIPLSDLCHGFPRTAADALLAYAEAQSFTAFLHAQFGRSGIDALLRAYADGVACERAPQLALGHPLSQLEHAWVQEYLAQSPWATLRETYPYLILLLVLLIIPLGMGWRMRTSSHL
ncbi:MAG: hypothetical protein Fur0018_06750 [Anaerolineales bacterium]